MAVQYTFLMAYNHKCYKIGSSVNPELYLSILQKRNPKDTIELVTYGCGITGTRLYDVYKHKLQIDDTFDFDLSDITDIKYTIATGSSLVVIGDNITPHETLELETSKHSKYVFTFGKYTGFRITEMLSPDQYDYCEWVYKYTPNRGKTCHDAMLWWISHGFSKYSGKLFDDDNLISYIMPFGKYKGLSVINLADREYVDLLMGKLKYMLSFQDLQLDILYQALRVNCILRKLKLKIVPVEDGSLS